MMMFGGSQMLSGRVDAVAGTYVWNGCGRESMVGPVSDRYKGGGDGRQ